MVDENEIKIDDNLGERWHKAADILETNKSDDVKLFEVFQLYKDDLKEHFTQFYYAMLGWKDAHLNELLKESDITENPYAKTESEE